MENMNDLHKRLDTLHCQVQAQFDALEAFHKAFVEHAKHLRRRDQVQCLDNLWEKVEKEITYSEYGEAVASLAFRNSKIDAGWLNFAAGTLAGFVFQGKKHPLMMGARMALNELANAKPFGTIMVGIGTKGVPDDVHVFPISEHARKLRISEAEVRAGLEAKGYCLFTREAFFEFIERLKGEILQGTSLPPALKSGTALKLLPP